MSHIHIPDGVLPLWLWGAGWVAAVALVWFASRKAERADIRRRVPLLGIVAALVLVSMSSEVVPIAYHVNLTVVAGVLLGPWLGAIAAFIVVVMLALLGHGGVTVIGLNTLMIATEMALGWALFRGLSRMTRGRRVRLVAGTSTVVTLAITTSMLVGIVALAGGGMATGRETGALDPGTMRFADPFSEGVVSIGTLKAERPEAGSLTVRRFAAVVFTLGPVGWLLEALVTAGVLGHLARVRPALVFAGALAARPRGPSGDEAAH